MIVYNVTLPGAIVQSVEVKNNQKHILSLNNFINCLEKAIYTSNCGTKHPHFLNKKLKITLLWNILIVTSWGVGVGSTSSAMLSFSPQFLNK